MNHEYDLFEKFQDGSSIWRDSIPGSGKTRLRLQELAQRSKNQFYAIDLETGEVLTLNSVRDSHAFRAPSITENRSKSHAG
jgi:hypothetical protein